MKGKIDADGNLWIERAGTWVQIRCPLQINYCNHSCRLWGEPWRPESLKRKALMPCRAGHDSDSIGCLTDTFDELTDERVAP